MDDKLITISLSKRTLLVLITILSFYGTYKWGYHKGWNGAWDALEAYQEAHKNDKKDGESGSFKSKEPVQS